MIPITTQNHIVTDVTRPRRPTRAGWAAGALGLAFALAACGGTATVADGTAVESSPTAPPTSATRRAPESAPTTPPPVSVAVTDAPPPERPSGIVDSHVDVGGARMHLRCAGAGGTTVVLIAGFGGDEDGWAEVVRSLSSDARVCTYSRFGTGTSDAPTRTATFATQSAELRTLLTNAGEPGPFVVVGHSFGGAQAVTFADMYQGEVTGVVLVDASPSTWITTICSVPDDGSDAAAGYGAVCGMASNPDANPERLDGTTAFDEVAAITTLGDVPLTVLTASAHAEPGLDPDEATRIDSAWHAGQERWASLSSSATLIDVGDTGHLVQVVVPDVVVEQIHSLLVRSDPK